MRLIQGISLSFTNLTKMWIGCNVGDWHYYTITGKHITKNCSDWVDFTYIKRR